MRKNGKTPLTAGESDGRTSFFHLHPLHKTSIHLANLSWQHKHYRKRLPVQLSRPWYLHTLDWSSVYFLCPHEPFCPYDLLLIEPLISTSPTIRGRILKINLPNHEWLLSVWINVLNWEGLLGDKLKWWAYIEREWEHMKNLFGQAQSS